jgi:hypothetical protein
VRLLHLVPLEGVSVEHRPLALPLVQLDPVVLLEWDQLPQLPRLACLVHQPTLLHSEHPLQQLQLLERIPALALVAPLVRVHSVLAHLEALLNQLLELLVLEPEVVPLVLVLVPRLEVQVGSVLEQVLLLVQPNLLLLSVAEVHSVVELPLVLLPLVLRLLLPLVVVQHQLHLELQQLLLLVPQQLLLHLVYLLTPPPSVQLQVLDLLHLLVLSLLLVVYLVEGLERPVQVSVEEVHLARPLHLQHLAHHLANLLNQHHLDNQVILLAHPLVVELQVHLEEQDHMFISLLW